MTVSKSPGRHFHATIAVLNPKIKLKFKSNLRLFSSFLPRRILLQPSTGIKKTQRVNLWNENQKIPYNSYTPHNRWTDWLIIEINYERKIDSDDKLDIYVYVCVFMYIYVCVYMYICVYVWVYMYIHLSIYVYMYVYICLYIYINGGACGVIVIVVGNSNSNPGCRYLHFTKR